jgi:hypothetical protein
MREGPLEKPPRAIIHEGHEDDKQDQQNKAIVKTNWPLRKNNDQKKGKTTVRFGLLREESGARLAGYI